MQLLFTAVAEIPALPVGFAGLTVPTTVLSPTLPQQLDMHFLKMNNTLSADPLYFLFFGASPFIGLLAGIYQPVTIKKQQACLL